MSSTKSSQRALAIALLSTAIAVPSVVLAAPAAGVRTRIDVYGSASAMKRDEDAFRAIQPGMNADDVLARLGAPEHRTRFDATRTTAWDYGFRDTWGYDAEFSVMVGDDGVVHGTFTGRHGA